MAIEKALASIFRATGVLACVVWLVGDFRCRSWRAVRLSRRWAGFHGPRGFSFLVVGVFRLVSRRGGLAGG